MQEIKKPCASAESKDSAEIMFCKSIAADLEKLSQKTVYGKERNTECCF